MSMSDPVADMLTRIRNAGTAHKAQVSMPTSKTKQSIAEVLLEEGYIAGYRIEGKEAKLELVIELKYIGNQAVIEHLKRVSRPGLRIYRGVDKLPKVWGGLGMAIISTSRGVMSDSKARSLGYGGEVLCTVA